MCWNTKIYSVSWTSTKICQKKWPPKNDNFSHFAKHKFIKKTVVLQPPFDQKLVFFNLVFWNQNHLCLTKKHKLKSGKSKDKRKGFERKKKTGNQKKGLMKKNCNWIFWCCSFHETKAQKKKNKEKDKNKEPKGNKKERQEGRKKKTRERERERDRDRARELKKGGQVRWPFGPPHLTLKPSKQNKKQNKKNKKTKKT